jgi:hypothetical protein
MAYEAVKRNRYFDPPTEFDHTSRNHAEDMAEFHAPLARMHHANLHDWGIARGLEVSGTIGGTDVIIEPGVAIDINGQLIALATGGLGDIGANPPGGLHTEVSVPVRLGFGSYVGQALYVTIQFAEILRLAEGSGGRFEQVPWIRFQPVSGGGAYVDNGVSIILAIVVIDAGGKLAELKVRDASLPYRRRLIGEAVEELRFRRSSKVGDRVQEVPAAKVAPSEGGGLQISLPNAGDRMLLTQEGGGNFSTFEVRANTVSVNGNLGLGTINPSRQLSLASTDPVIQLRDTNDSVGNHWEIQANAFVPNNFGMVRFEGNAAQPSKSVVVSSNGNLGIGTVTPNQKLHVSGGNGVINNTFLGEVGYGSEWAGFSHSNSANTSGYGLLQSSSGIYTLINKKSGGGYIGFRVDNQDKMVINDSGNVGIGTASPQGKLDVRGDIRAGGSDIYFTETTHNHTGIGNTAGYAALENASNYGALMILGRAGTPKGRTVKLWDYLQVNGDLDVTGRLNANNFNASGHVLLYTTWFWASAWNGENSIYHWIYHQSRTYFEVITWYAVQDISYGEAGTQEGKMALSQVTAEDGRTQFRVYVKNCYAFVWLNALCIRK